MRLLIMIDAFVHDRETCRPPDIEETANERIFTMPDPITLSALGVVALTEGIKFLYEQAGEVLKRWRERKDAAKDTTTNLPKAEPVAVTLPPVFEGQLTNPQIHYDAVEKLEQQLSKVKKDLSEYADGSDKVDTTNEALLEQIDAFRQLMEAVYQQRITFKGEQRPPSGQVVEGHITVQDVEGRVGGVLAKSIRGGSRIKGIAKVEGTVKQGGEAAGVNADNIGT